MNSVAMSTLKIVYPTLLDVGCFSHTLGHVGEKFRTPTLSDFITLWINLFSHSSKSKLAWKDQTSVSIATYSTTRWWSKWEVVNQVPNLFGDVEAFLWENLNLSSSVTRSKLLAFFDDPVKKALLQIEIAATVDAGMPFVKATYKIEGDGPLAYECYEIISALSVAAQITHFPNVDALARQMDNSQQWKTYALQCVQPGLNYFHQHLNGCLQSPLAAFKAARLPDILSVDSLASFPFLNIPSVLSALKAELLQYVASTEDLAASYYPLRWWRENESVLPTWSACARKVLVV